MGLIGVIFRANRTGILSGCAALPLMSLLFVFRSFVTRVGSHIGSGLVDLSAYRNALFHDLVVVFLVCHDGDH